MSGLPQEYDMDDARSDAWHDAPDQHGENDKSNTEQRSAWERALDGPPINPRSELIYHDRHRR